MNNTQQQHTDASAGVVYLGFGQAYLAMALVSAESLRLTNPEIPVCIITNVCPTVPAGVTFWNDAQDYWIPSYLCNDENRRYKTDIAKHSPFSKTIYLDCDTLVLRDISLAWVMLEYFDLCALLKPKGQQQREKVDLPVLDGRARVGELPHWNAGVLMFANTEKTRNFFESWRTRFQERQLPWDQVSFLETIYHSDCRILALDSRWNADTIPIDPKPGQEPRILHYHSVIDRQLEFRLRHYASLLADSQPAPAQAATTEDSIERYLQWCRRNRFKKDGIIKYYRKRRRHGLYRKKHGPRL